MPLIQHFATLWKLGKWRSGSISEPLTKIYQPAPSVQLADECNGQAVTTEMK